MFNKKNMWKVLLCMICVMGVLGGCTNQDPQNVVDNKKIETEKQEEETKEKEEAVKEGNLVKNGELYSFGEIIQLEGSDPTNQNYIAEEYTIQQVQIFNSPEEAGVPREQIRDRLTDQINYTGESMTPDKESLLVCDMTLKNINRDSLSLNITRVSLVYRYPDTGEMSYMSEIAYFSKSVDTDPDSTKLYHYDLAKGESMDARVAWLIDMNQYDLDDLYIGIEYDGGAPKFVKIKSE